MGSSMFPSGNVRTAERLVGAGLITQEQLETALHHVQRTGDRIEEALLEIQALDEPSLLRFLASVHKTRFVSTEKLSRADIDRATLDKVPKKLAEPHMIFPVLYDAQSNVLSVVTPDPDNAPALHEVQLACGAREVRAFIGRPRAVHAAILKAYNGDIHAFALLDRKAHEQFTSMLDVYERNVVSEETLAAALATEGAGRGRMLSGSEIEKGQAVAVAGVSVLGVATESFLETLNVLISMLESARPGLRGHSAQVARLLRKIGERLGLAEADQTNLVLAGYIHDLGKMGAHHLTSLNVAEFEGHKAAALKLYHAPSRLLEAVKLPREATQAVEGMYERYDGAGFPQGISGKEITLAARLLAIADTYADLTQNAKNPFRKRLSAAEACEALARYRGTVFDPNLLDLVRHAITGDDLKARLLSDRHRTLIVDPDPEETTVLELRLVEQGFEVVQARNTDQALKLLEPGDIELVISEIDLAPIDGFALLAQARQQSSGHKLPWVFVTHRSAGAEAQRAFAAGATDYVTKPVSADLLVAKLRTLLEREATGAGRRGVSGSLAEMSLPEMVQVLWHGRKTGALKIRASGVAGEIHFVSGSIYNALWQNLRGEEAFYAMLGLREGDFALDPNFHAPQQLIAESPESLLLEGMRRMDESS
jgi:response regulator RpfG family c-di-GMP phosphodiesterase